MDNLWSTAIEKLMIWQTGSWSKYDSKTTKWTLQIVYDVLIIAETTKIFERISLHSKIKGFYKGDVLILILSNPAQEVRKIKFLIKGNVPECLKKLAQHFPIVNHNASQPGILVSQYRNMDEVMKNAVESIGETSTLAMPKEFDNFVKLCLLDPNMPKIIQDTQKIIDGLNNEQK